MPILAGAAPLAPLRPHHPGTLTLTLPDAACDLTVPDTSLHLTVPDTILEMTR